MKEEVFRRGGYADGLYDEPGWPVALTGLGLGSYRTDAPLAGPRLRRAARLSRDRHDHIILPA